MILRLSKTLLVAAVALYYTLVVFNNLTDYGSDYALCTMCCRWIPRFRATTVCGARSIRCGFTRSFSASS